MPFLSKSQEYSFGPKQTSFKTCVKGIIPKTVQIILKKEECNGRNFST